MPAQIDFELTGWVPNQRLLGPVRERDALLARAHPVGPEARDVISAFLQLGATEVATHSSMNDPRFYAATEDAIHAASRYWFARGKEGYMALGVHMGYRFVRALQAVLAAAEDAGRPVLVWVKGHPDDPRVHELDRIGGSFVPAAVSWGLITRDNAIAGGSPELARIHFKLRWVRLVNEITDYTFLLDPQELLALWRWRAEGDRSLAMERKVQLARRIRELDRSYPVYRVIGTLFGQRQRWDMAATFLREALLDDPFNDTVRRNLAYAWAEYQRGAAR